MGTAGGTCGATLAVDASCTINLVFRPTATGNYTRTLTVTATGTGMVPVPVSLTGSGVVSPVSPALLTITLPTGVNSGTGVVTFTNDLSTGPIGIGTISITNFGIMPAAC